MNRFSERSACPITNGKVANDGTDVTYFDSECPKQDLGFEEVDDGGNGNCSSEGGCVPKHPLDDESDQAKRQEPDQARWLLGSPPPSMPRGWASKMNFARW
ncbi:hypothetical protein CGZ80_27145 [Rhodopirellula sp. MGV]|nr:hypothetical protein CGZ80_27145 [Rhodopirellula sp. MGV]